MLELTRIKTLLQSGRLTDAQIALKKLKLNKLSRADRLNVAILARETRVFQVAIEVLYPIIQAHRHKKTKASASELTEYAYAIANIGATNEAKSLLQGVEHGIHAVFALSRAYFREWDYEGAIACIENTQLVQAELSENDQLIFDYTYAVALIFARKDFERARDIMRSILARLKEDHFLTLRYDVLLVTASSYFLEKKWEECEKLVSGAQKVFGAQASQNVLQMTFMWQSLLGLAKAVEQGKNPLDHLAKVEQARIYFQQVNKPYFARSCDFYVAFCTHDREKFIQLYFRATHPATRKHIQYHLQAPSFSIPDCYDIQISDAHPTNTKINVVLDLSAEVQCQLGNSRALKLKIGQLPYRLLTALAADSYLRPNLLELFIRIYPDEFYDPRSSDAKVANGILRLRKELEKSKIPLSIINQQGCYRLKAEKGVILRLARPKADHRELVKDNWRAKTRKAFGVEKFTASDFAKKFQLTDRTARYQLQIACKKGWASRLGKGPATSYQLID